MSDPRVLLVKPLVGFNPRIGELVSMMNYTRMTTVGTVLNMTVAQLDFLIDPQANSIGALLSHIAWIETVFQITTLENRQPIPEEYAHWNAAMRLGEAARAEIKGQPLEHYLGLLEQIRSKTLAAFAQLDDDWLYQETLFWNDKPANNYFKWFHVFEDELNHRGQIRLIKKRFPSDLI
jgi:uncharacterized damage-inducible protein DinB